MCGGDVVDHFWNGGGGREVLDLEDKVGRGDRVGKLSGLLGLLELLFFCMVSYSCVETMGNQLYSLVI